MMMTRRCWWWWWRRWWLISGSLNGITYKHQHHLLLYDKFTFLCEKKKAEKVIQCGFTSQCNAYKNNNTNTNHNGNNNFTCIFLWIRFHYYYYDHYAAIKSLTFSSVPLLHVKVISQINKVYKRKTGWMMMIIILSLHIITKTLHLHFVGRVFSLKGNEC